MIEQILERFAYFDRENGSLIATEQLQEWPDASVADLGDVGLLVRAGYRKTVVCNGCEQACLKTVLQSQVPEGLTAASFFIACEEYEEVGRISVNPVTLEQWQIDIYQFTKMLAAALVVESEPEEIVPGQVFNIGTLTINQRIRSVVFAVNRRVFNSYLDNGYEIGSNPVFLIGAGQRETEHISGGFAIPLGTILLESKTSLQVDLEELRRLLSPPRKKSPLALLPVQTPENLRWENVVITFVNPDAVQIKYKDFSEPRTADEMGFGDSRGAKEPLTLWRLLLEFAKNEGVLSPTFVSDTGYPDSFKKRISRLSERLSAAFPNIEGSPIHHYNRRRGYQTRFVINVSPNFYS